MQTITDLNLCTRRTSNDDCPAIKAHQITEEAALNRDVLTDLQLSAALVENDWYAL